MTPESVDPQIVGNAFVQKYYNHLYESTDEVHRFYLEGSVLGRPGLDGEMVYVKSLKDINDQIMSFDYENSKIEILTADSQPSLKNGVVTLVTGLMIWKEGKRLRFSQNFFLVSQKGSYFVLNDIYRYDSDEIVEPEDAESPRVIESTEVITEPADEVVEVVIIPNQAKTTVAKPVGSIANGDAQVPKEKIVNGSSNLPQEDAPKRSFAAVIVAQNGTPSNVKASPAKSKPAKKPSGAPEPKAPAPIPEQPSAKTIEPKAQGGSIFVANLPMDETREQLYETFKSFGAIRKNGIQIRSYTEQRNCFGFVTFESGEAVKNVLQAHKETPFRIGNRRTAIEEKRANNNNENGGKASARSNGNYRNENGNRNDGHRPRGNGYNGGRSNGRNGVERRSGEAAGDAKASQSNGHGNAQARN